MSNISVDQIQSEVAAIVDQDEKTSDISATDYSLRLRYINTAQKEWAEAYDWQVLYKEFNTLASTSTGNASVVMPADFRKLASFPQISYDGANTYSFTEARPQELPRFNSSDRVIAMYGNPNIGYTMFVPNIAMVSGASIKIPYYSSPQSLASPADISSCPNDLYLVKRTVAYLWEAREDPRYPAMKAEAQTILGHLIDYENTFGEASTYDRVRTVDENRFGFRIGKF